MPLVYMWTVRVRNYATNVERIVNVDASNQREACEEAYLKLKDKEFIVSVA